MKLSSFKKLIFFLCSTSVCITCSSMIQAKTTTTTTSSCPSYNSLNNFKVANNVTASFENTGLTSTYSFFSIVNENPAGGIPGLIKYCVYPTPSQKPNTLIVQAKGANGSNWQSKLDPKDFLFQRAAGDKTNIPLNGTKTVMGSATWNTLPTNQIILLHINDPAVCLTLYGSSSPSTCFVKPNPVLSCNSGEGSNVAAYNAIPYGGVNCGPPSESFEGDGVSEFGDQVTLAAGTPRQLDSMKVLFTSYGCSVSGHWYSGDCVTNSGATFNVPITAKVYDANSCSGTNPIICSSSPLASVTITQAIPYRPSANLTLCTGADTGKWFNPLRNGGIGGCQNSIATILTFAFPAGTTLPNNVVWTVSFNTSHSGYTPMTESTACYTSSIGCGYDSLNVGAKSYPGAPYSGIDIDEDLAFWNYYSGPGIPTNYPPPYGFGVLTPSTGVQSTSGWIGFRPLGEIITK